MSDEIAVENRDALYYPYTAISDVNWLKATLLCFPSVWLMLPPPRAMSAEVNEFLDTEGPRGPLLNFLEAEEWDRRAQANLLQNIQHNEHFLVEHYSQTATVKQYGLDVDRYRLHVKKPGQDLIEHLKSAGLAWQYTLVPTIINGKKCRTMSLNVGLDTDEWMAMHPKLGEAILSTVAVALADDYAVDIVTDSPAVHRTVVCQPPEFVFDDLLDQPTHTGSPDLQQTVDELAHCVMTTAFDVTRFSAADIGDMLKDGNDLRRFKSAVKRIAANTPKPPNAARRQKYLQEATGQILDE